MKENVTEEQAGKILDSLYAKTLSGIPKVSKSVEKLADEYLKRYKAKYDAVKAFINYQISKCGASGFVTGLGGLITLPVAVPANVSSVLYVQLRMVGAIAYMYGYNLCEDEVQTMIYLCLTGSAMTTMVKQVGIKVTTKLATNGLKKLPGKILIKINQKVGFRLLTKFGTKGAINLVKAIPVVGGVVGAGLDIGETKIISHNAIKTFRKNSMGTHLAASDSAK